MEKLTPNPSMLTLHNPRASLPGEHEQSREENYTENRRGNPAPTFTTDLKSQLEKEIPQMLGKSPSRSEPTRERERLEHKTLRSSLRKVLGEKRAKRNGETLSGTA